MKTNIKISLLSVLLLTQLIAISKIKRELLHLNLGLLNIEKDQYFYHLTDNIDDVILPSNKLFKDGERISIDNNNYEVILIKDKNAKDNNTAMMVGDQIKIKSAKHKGAEVIVRFQNKTVDEKK